MRMEMEKIATCLCIYNNEKSVRLSVRREGVQMKE